MGNHWNWTFELFQWIFCKISHCLWWIYIRLCSFHFFRYHLITFTFTQLWDSNDHTSWDCVISSRTVILSSKYKWYIITRGDILRLVLCVWRYRSEISPPFPSSYIIPKDSKYILKENPLLWKVRILINSRPHSLQVAHGCLFGSTSRPGLQLALATLFIKYTFCTQWPDWLQVFETYTLQLI